MMTAATREEERGGEGQMMGITTMESPIGMHIPHTSARMSNGNIEMLPFCTVQLHCIRYTIIKAPPCSFLPWESPA